MRQLGGLGMSIGTSMCFENEAPATIRTTDSVLINLWTLTRNAQQSFLRDDPDSTSPEKIAAAVDDDLAKISNWLNETRGTRPISLVVYYPTYKSLDRKFNKADLWEPKSDLQKANAKLMKESSEIVYKKYEKHITRNDCDLPEFGGKALIITHHVVDLTLTNSTTRLYLLESHTGLIKPYTQWYTKLTGGDNLYYMPFNRLTIQVFGDKSTNFKSSTHGIKMIVKNLAEQSKWTSATTMDKVRKNINSLPGGIEKAGLLLLLK